MRKLFLLFTVLILTSSCNNDDIQEFQRVFLPIDEATVPQSFVLNQVDTIRVKYTLPDNCHAFRGLFYQHQGASRVVAINALQALNAACTDATVQEELKFPIFPSQTSPYLFKFWKGTDSAGNDIFEEILVPVNSN